MDYNKEVMKRFRNPKFYKRLKRYNGIGEVGNPRCGDVMKIYIYVENEVIKDISFETFGCVAAIATSDALCEIVKGMTLKEAEKITNQDIINALGALPPVKVHCSVLGREALEAAIKDYRKRKHLKSKQ